MNEVSLTVEEMLWMDIVKIELHKGNTLEGSIKYATTVADSYKTKFKQENA